MFAYQQRFVHFPSISHQVEAALGWREVRIEAFDIPFLADAVDEVRLTAWVTRYQRRNFAKRLQYQGNVTLTLRGNTDLPAMGRVLCEGVELRLSPLSFGGRNR